MHKVIQLISKKITTKNAPFYESTCSLDELDDKPNHTKMWKFWKFERKGCKVRNHLTKKIVQWVQNV